MKVIITTPYPIDSLNGNTVCAQRIAKMLEQEGIQVQVIEVGKEQPVGDVLIALHARKSAPSIQEFRRINPTGRIILFLTGTDLYEDIPKGCSTCLESMRLADVLVVSQEASLASVPAEFSDKTKVIYKSIELPEKIPVPDLQFSNPLFSIVGHLRKVKNPFLAVKALRHIKADCRLYLLGRALEDGFAEQAERLTHSEPRFRWLGQRPHAEALGWMKLSTATINSSFSEGGANSIGESIMLGTPVLASKVEGNIGMLGVDYDGYFESNNAQELAQLMNKIIAESSFRDSLKQQVIARSAVFQRKRERDGWLQIIHSNHSIS